MRGLRPHPNGVPDQQNSIVTGKGDRGGVMPTGFTACKTISIDASTRAGDEAACPIAVDGEG